MVYFVLHHSGGNQHINQPSDIGGKWQFYNIIVTPDKVFEQYSTLHNRGPFDSLDVCLSGNFLIDIPTSSQLNFTKDLIKRYNYPVIGHKDLKLKGATIGILDTECPGNLLSYLLEDMNVLSDSQLNNLWLAVFKRPIDAAGLSAYHGKSFDEVINAVLSSPENAEYAPIFQAIKKLENDARSRHF